MKSLSISLIIMAMLCAGCKKESSNNNNGHKTNLINKETVTTGGITFTQEYSYDGQNRLIDFKISDYADYKYTYDSNNNLATVQTFNSNNILVGSDKYSYSGTTVTAQKYDANNNPNGSYTFTLNAQQQVIATSLDNETFTYDNKGNVSNLTATGTNNFTQAFTYDNEKNPLSMLGAKNLHLMYVLTEPCTFINNTITDGSNNPPTTYTYNGDGFPVSSATGSLTVTYEYITK